MEPGHRASRSSVALRCCAALLGIACLAACSSSFGGGGSAPQPNTIVVPQGSAMVCQDGGAPPCN